MSRLPLLNQGESERLRFASTYVVIFDDAWALTEGAGAEWAEISGPARTGRFQFALEFENPIGGFTEFLDPIQRRRCAGD